MYATPYVDEDEGTTMVCVVVFSFFGHTEDITATLTIQDETGTLLVYCSICTFFYGTDIQESVINLYIAPYCCTLLRSYSWAY